MLAEFVRARLPLGGFEWAQLGHLVADLPVRAAAGVVGSLGVSGLVVALAAGLVVTAERWPLRRRLMPVAAAVVAAVGLAAVGSLSWTHPAGELSVALVQVDPVCPGRPMVACPHQPERLRQAFIAATRDLPGEPDLVVWSEGALSRLTPQEAGVAVVGRLGPLSAPLLAGVTTPAGESGCHNRNVVYDRHGRVVAAYAKRHPVPFGEYVPARGWLGDVGDVGRLVPRDLIAGHTPGRLDPGAVTNHARP